VFVYLSIAIFSRSLSHFGGIFFNLKKDLIMKHFSREKAIADAVRSATPRTIRSINTAKTKQVKQSIKHTEIIGEALASAALAGVMVTALVGFWS
jgi:uncharacterized protein YlbG (UPF0298 family)